MPWWPKWKKGLHRAAPVNRRPASAMEQAVTDFKESIARRSEVDRLTFLARQRFGPNRG